MYSVVLYLPIALETPHLVESTGQFLLILLNWQTTATSPTSGCHGLGNAQDDKHAPQSLAESVHIDTG